MLSRLSKRRPPGVNASSEGGGTQDAVVRVEAASADDTADVDRGAAAAMDKEVQMLVSMGFDPVQAKQALAATGGDVTEATMMLLPGGDLEVEPASPAPASSGQASQQEWPSARADPGAADHLTDPTGSLVTDDLDTMLDEALRLSREEMEKDTARREEQQVHRESLDDMLAQIGQQGVGASGGQSDGEDLELRAALELSKRQHENQEAERHRRLKERQAEDRRLYARLMDERAQKEINGLQAHACAPGMKSSSSEAVLSRPTSRSSRSGLEKPSSRGGLLPSKPSSRGGLLPSPKHHQSAARSADFMDDLAEMSGAARASSSRPQSEGDIIGLDDLDGWNKGSGLFGVSSICSTYPSKPLPIMPRQNPAMSQAQFGAPELRPVSKRAGRNNNGGMSSSSSTPLLAAAALSIS